jgi:hypothetical protein
MGSATEIIVDVVAVAVSFVAGPEVGAAILGFESAEAAVAAGYAIETITEIGAASTGAASSAINSAAAGGSPEDILKAAAIGGASSAIAAGIGAEVGGVTEAPGQAGPTPAELGYTPPPSQTITPSGIAGATGSTSAGTIGGATAGGFTKGFTQAELSGQNLQTALKRGEIGGLTGLATSGFSELLQEGGVDKQGAKTASALSAPYLSKQVSGYFPSSTPASQVSSQKASSSGGLPTTGTRSLGGGGGGGGQRVGSAALGQALNVGGFSGATGGSSGTSGGYGASGEKTSPETGGTPQNVWNIESLRYKPEEA